MTDDRHHPIEPLPLADPSLDEAPPEEWPPKEWAKMDAARDPDRGQHLVWVLFAAVVFLVGWYVF